MIRAMSFRTHTGEIIRGDRLRAAMSAVADDYVKLAHDIHREDRYASHVTEARKEEILAKTLVFADDIRQGAPTGGFTVWQRINSKLTGECIAFLPPKTEIPQK